MKKLLFILTLLLSTGYLTAQNIDRIEVKGRVIVNVDELENITIYNMSSNKGTVTDSLGQFKIKVALNDEIQISSVQLIPFKTKITNAVIDTKVLKVYLKEYINTLDEVVLLPYDLTGDLETDITDVKEAKPIVFQFESFENFEMADDYLSRVENIAMGSQNDRIRYQANGMAIVGLLTNLIFKKKKKNKKDIKDPRLETPVSTISNKLPDDYFTENFNIPKEREQEFIAYLENLEFDMSLLESKNELKLIEYLHSASNAFLNEKKN